MMKANIHYENLSKMRRQVCFIPKRILYLHCNQLSLVLTEERDIATYFGVLATGHVLRTTNPYSVLAIRN